jgi:hypothetical protein
MSQTPEMTWQEIRAGSAERGLLAKRPYVVNSLPTDSLGAVLANLDLHLQD